MKKLLVLGIGNTLLMDEGVGPAAVLELAKEKWPENVHMIEAGTFTQDIFFLFKNYDALLVLDCVRANHPGGTIYVLDEDDLVKNDDQRLSVHDIDMLDSLRMAELMGNRPTMRVIGMEPIAIEWKMELSDRCKERMPLFLETAREEIRKVLAGWENEGAAE